MYKGGIGGTGGSSSVPDIGERFVLDFLLPHGNLLVPDFPNKLIIKGPLKN